MSRRNRYSGLTLVEMLVISGVMAVALVGALKAVTIARHLSDRGDRLTQMMLRAHSELEERKAMPFARLEIGSTPLGGFDDPNTTGIVTVARLPDSPGRKITVEISGQTWRGEETIHLSALRFPEASR